MYYRINAAWRQRLWFLLRLLISAGVIALIARSLDLEDVRRRLLSVSPWAVVAAAVVVFLQIVINSWRWSAICRRIGLGLTLPLAIRLSFEGQFFNQVLPSSIGGDVVRGLRLAQISGQLRAPLESVVIDRLTGVLALAVLVLLSFPYLFMHLPDPAFRIGFSLFVLGAVVGMALLLSLHRLPPSLRDLPVLREVVGVGVRAVQVIATPSFIPFMTLSILTHVMIGLTFWILAIGSGIGLSLDVAVATVPAAMLATLLPVSIAGWGLREGAIVILLSYWGVAAEDALALSVGYGLLLLTLSLVGGPFWLMRSQTGLQHDE